MFFSRTPRSKEQKDSHLRDHNSAPLLDAGGAGSETWDRVYMIAPVKKFGRARLSTNFCC